MGLVFTFTIIMFKRATKMTKGEEIVNIYFSRVAVECICCVIYIIRVIAVLATSVLYHL